MPNIKLSILSFTMTFICLFLSGGPSQAQNGPYIDSISNIVESQEGTVQVASYRRMFQTAMRISPDIAKEYVDSSRSKSIQLNHRGLIASTSSDYEIYLNYTADYEEAIVLVFNKKGTDYAWYNEAEGKVKAKFNIKDPNSPLGVVPLDDVGSAVQLGNKRLYLFNKTGLLNSRLIYVLEDWAGNIDPPTIPMGVFSLDDEDGDQIFLVDDTFSDTPG